MTHASFTVDAALAGQRLDRALARLLPELSLRARRRLWVAESGGQVLVNGRPRPPGHAVAAGDSIAVCMGDATALPADAATPPSALPPFPGGDSPRFVEARHGLLFLHKPAGLHSASLPAGRGGYSLEHCLSELLPAPLREAFPAPALLNRLDCGTSGLVLAAGDAAAARRWHAAEDSGQCCKSYVALLTGRLEQEMIVTRALDTDKRRVSRVLPGDAPPLRHTLLRPLLSVQAGDMRGLAPWSPDLATCPADTVLTLALCRIRKGARHQIRAHAAHAGFPLWGDGRYGGTPREEAENAASASACFILHHGCLRMPEMRVADPCPWMDYLPEKIANNFTQCLKVNNILS